MANGRENSLCFPSGSNDHPTCSHYNRQHGKMHPCPVKNERCRRCNKIVHFDTACQTCMLKEVAATLLILDEIFFVTETLLDIIEQLNSEKECFVDLPINGSTVEFCQD